MAADAEALRIGTAGADARAAAARPRGRANILSAIPVLVILLLVGPLAAGLLGTLVPAFGWLPALGGERFGLAAFGALFAKPGVAASVRLSAVTGLAATALSFTIVVLFAAAWHGTTVFARMQRLLSPLLSVPHVTVALGLAFLLAPSGWLLRLLSPWATGLERPPDLAIVQDPYGLALIAGLVAKEVPFLLLMLLAALGQADAERTRTVARSLGYGPVAAWLKAVFPRVYPQIRLPVFAVLAYSLSVVDMALVLAPTTPPPLSVRLLRWFNDPDLSLRFVASAGAVVQLGLVVAAMALWIAAEAVVGRIGAARLPAGRRGRHDAALRWAAAGILALVMGAALAGLLGMAVWSVAGVWRWPDALPAVWSFDNWVRQWSAVARPALHTACLAGLTTAAAVLLSVGCLEHEARRGRSPGRGALWLLYAPLLVPQIAFLFGVQVLLVLARLDGSWTALVWTHLLFVLPYVFLSLADPYRAFDERCTRTALCLGASRARVVLAIKLPMLLRPILTAAAVGFAVSVGLYLPTIFAGGGRVATLTTEAVALAAGGDRRLIGMHATLQMALPFLAFSAALFVPAWLFRHRRGLQVTR